MNIPRTRLIVPLLCGLLFVTVSINAEDPKTPTPSPTPASKKLALSSIRQTQRSKEPTPTPTPKSKAVSSTVTERTGGGSSIQIRAYPVEVQVSDAAGTVIAQTKTDSKGEISFNAPKPGTYVITATSGPDKGKVLTKTTVKTAGKVARLNTLMARYR